MNSAINYGLTVMSAVVMFLAGYAIGRTYERSQIDERDLAELVRCTEGLESCVDLVESVAEQRDVAMTVLDRVRDRLGVE